MSHEYSLVGVFPGSMPELEAVRKAAQAVGLDPSTIPHSDPRFDGEGLLVFAVQSDEYDQDLTRRHFGFESNLSLVFSEHSGSDDGLMIQAMRNVLRVSLAFAQDDPTFRGELIDDYTDNGYLAHVRGGTLTLNERFWKPWRAAPEVLDVVPQPHRFADLRVR